MSVISLQRLPLGFRFNPKDEELINHYLKRKINGRSKSDIEVIPEIDVCKCEPWDLPAKSLIQSDDNRWYFFAPKDRKYPNGQRSNRATVAGYWKATGKDRIIRLKGPASKNAVIGMKKTLVFHRGRAPKGTRTCWIMHEYRTTEPEFESGDQGGYVLYLLFKKSEESCPIFSLEEIEIGGLPPTPTQSSPGDTQHEVDVIEDAENSMKYESLKSFLQDDFKTSDESQPTVIRKWLDETTAQIAICLDNPCLNLSTDSHKAKAEEVDPLQEFLIHLLNFECEQPNENDFPDISSPLLSYSDHPFLSSNNQEPNVGFFTEENAEKSSLDDLLNADMFFHGRSYIQEDSINATELVTSIWDSASYKDSVSSCEMDTESGLAQLNMLQKAADMESGSYGCKGSIQMDTFNGYPAYNSQLSTLYEDTSLIPFDSISLDVYSLGSASESLQDLLSNSEESSYPKNSAANADGPIIEIRSRRSQHPLNPDDELVHQGTTNRRIRLQSSVNNMFDSSVNNKLLADEETKIPQEPLFNGNSESGDSERQEPQEEEEHVDENFIETEDTSQPLQIEKQVQLQTDDEPPISSDIYLTPKSELRMRAKTDIGDETEKISSLLLNKQTRSRPSAFANLMWWVLIAILLVICGGIYNSYVMLHNV